VGNCQSKNLAKSKVGTMNMCYFHVPPGSRLDLKQMLYSERKQCC